MWCSIPLRLILTLGIMFQCKILGKFRWSDPCACNWLW
jgi:hypothetical protein